MTFTTLRPFGALLIVLAFVTLAGCSGKDSPSGPPDTTPTSATFPGAGSIWTFSGISTNLAGQVVQNKESTIAVAETKINLAGKTDVVKLVGVGGNGGYTYFSYGANGDLAMMYYMTINGVVMDSTWAIYPFGSRGTHVLPNWDTTYQSTRGVSSGSIRYLGEQTVTVAGETFETKMAILTTHLSMKNSDGNEFIGQSRIDTVWYAPRIFYYVKQRGWQQNRSPFGVEEYYNIGDLKSYTLR